MPVAGNVPATVAHEPTSRSQRRVTPSLGFAPRLPAKCKSIWSVQCGKLLEVNGYVNLKTGIYIHS